MQKGVRRLWTIGALAVIGLGCHALFRVVEKEAVASESRRWTALFDFQIASKTMPPEGAARGWLALLYAEPNPATEKAVFSNLGEIRKVDFKALVRALPAPESWPMIANGIRKRTAGRPKTEKDASLEFFAAWLTEDSGAQARALEEIRSFGDQWGRVGSFSEALAFETNAPMPSAPIPASPPEPLLDAGAGEKALKRTDLDPRKRLDIQNELLRARLEVGLLEEGVALMREMLREPVPMDSGKMEIAVTLARMGAALGRPGWANEGIREAERLDAQRNGPYHWEDASEAYIELLIDLRRFAEAERLLRENYRVEAIDLYKEPRALGGVWIVPRRSHWLPLLAQLYYRANRPEALRALLDDAPEWGVVDVAGLQRESVSIFSGSEETPTALAVAWALAKTGEPGRARQLLDRVLSDSAGYDPAYRLLLDLAGEGAVAELDRLYALDPLEERPLIWKAVALKTAGRLEEAEAAVRQAIAVDPSDGGTPIARRRFAEKVLSEVLAARGETEEAETHAQVWRGIETARRAGDLETLGLRAEALKTSLEALRDVDDYSVRLAVAKEMEAFGRPAEAEAQYRRAYRSMTETLGYTELPTFFGAGDFFPTSLSRRVAEAILALAPRSPRTLYLLSYLRYDEGRYRESRSLSAQVTGMKPAQRWLFPLVPDPANLSRAERWRKADRELAARGLGQPESIYPLEASRAQIRREIGLEEGRILYDRSLNELPTTAGDTLSDGGVVEAIAELTAGT